MYLWEVDIKNIYGIEHFKIQFKPGQEAGWHVLIGENGSGKTSILYCMACALLVERMKPALTGQPRLIRNGQNHGSIAINVPTNSDKIDVQNHFLKFEMNFSRTNPANGTGQDANELKVDDKKNVSQIVDRIFAVAYSTYRDFRGGNDEFFQGRMRNFRNLFLKPQGFEHLSQWFKDRIVEIHGTDDDEAKQSDKLLEAIFGMVNHSKILPGGFTMLPEITVDGPMVADASGFKAPASDISEGVRSVLGLTLDILVSMVNFYTAKRFLEAYIPESGSINLPGIFLIDEIDAHLHPSWQTEIGTQLMRIFPKVQFIVTTHSPLICRAADRGSIWKLPALGTGQVEEVTGIEKDRLVFGNVLDAFGTELFGSEPVKFRKNDEKRSRLGKLKMRSALGVITEEERAEKLKLEMTLATDDTPAI